MAAPVGRLSVNVEPINAVLFDQQTSTSQTASSKKIQFTFETKVAEGNVQEFDLDKMSVWEKICNRFSKGPILLTDNEKELQEKIHACTSEIRPKIQTFIEELPLAQQARINTVVDDWKAKIDQLKMLETGLKGTKLEKAGLIQHIRQERAELERSLTKVENTSANILLLTTPEAATKGLEDAQKDINAISRLKFTKKARSEQLAKYENALSRIAMIKKHATEQVGHQEWVKIADSPEIEPTKQQIVTFYKKSLKHLKTEKKLFSQEQFFKALVNLRTQSFTSLPYNRRGNNERATSFHQKKVLPLWRDIEKLERHAAKALVNNIKNPQDETSQNWQESLAQLDFIIDTGYELQRSDQWRNLSLALLPLRLDVKQKIFREDHACGISSAPEPVKDKETFQGGEFVNDEIFPKLQSLMQDPERIKLYETDMARLTHLKVNNEDVLHAEKIDPKPSLDATTLKIQEKLQLDDTQLDYLKRILHQEAFEGMKSNLQVLLNIDPLYAPEKQINDPQTANYEINREEGLISISMTYVFTSINNIAFEATRTISLPITSLSEDQTFADATVTDKYLAAQQRN